MPETLPETLPPCPRADCDAYPEDAPHHFHNWWGDSLPHRERIGTCITGGPGLSSRCYSAHVNLSESPTGSTGGDFRDKLAGDSPDKTIRRWLDRSREYPTTNGRLGWVADRDELIALLSECSPRGISASVIPVAVPGGDMVGFYVQTSIHFARSELSAIGEPRRAAEGVE